MTGYIEIDKYNVYIGNAGQCLREQILSLKPARIFVLVDENTYLHCLPVLRQQLPATLDANVIKIPQGEDNKNTGTCAKIWGELLSCQAPRNSLMINLGGGVISDMGGFAAATFKRGIPFINVPTSLLAMVDATVGGKTGINFHGIKNCIGLFQNPIAVALDVRFLKTLPERHLRNGFAEMLKHGLIADLNYWNSIKDLNPLIDLYEKEITYSIRIKKEIVEKDPFEKGIRKTLNFGHSIGHAIESFSLKHSDHPLLHGEAIAIGMICESFISSKISGLSEKELENIIDIIKKHFPLSRIPENRIQEILQLIYHDKKKKDKELNFTLLQRIGQPLIDVAIEEQLIRLSLDFYNNIFK